MSQPDSPLPVSIPIVEAGGESLQSLAAQIAAKAELVRRLPELSGLVGSSQFCEAMGLRFQLFYAAANHEGRLAYFTPAVVAKIGQEIGSAALPSETLLTLAHPQEREVARALCDRRRTHGSWGNRFRREVIRRINAITLSRRETQRLLEQALAIKGVAPLGRVIFGQNDMNFENFFRRKAGHWLNPKKLVSIQQAVGQAVRWEVVASLGFQQRRHRVAAELRRIYRKGHKVHPRVALDTRLRMLPHSPEQVLDSIVALLGCVSRSQLLHRFQRTESTLGALRRRNPNSAWAPRPLIVSLQTAVGNRMHPDNLIVLATPQHRLELYPELIEIYEAAARAQATASVHSPETATVVEPPSSKQVWQEIGRALGYEVNQSLARALKISWMAIRNGPRPQPPARPLSLAIEVVEYLARLTHGMLGVDSLAALQSSVQGLRYRERLALAVEQARTQSCELIDPTCSERKALLQELTPLASCGSFRELAVVLQSCISFPSCVACGVANFSDEKLATLAVLLEGKIPPRRLLLLGAPWSEGHNLAAMETALRQVPTVKQAVRRRALFARMYWATEVTTPSALASLLHRSGPELAALLGSGHSLLGAKPVLDMRAQLLEYGLSLTLDDCRILCATREHSQLEARLEVLELPDNFEASPPAWLNSLREKVSQGVRINGEDEYRMAECSTNPTVRRFLGLKMKRRSARRGTPSAKYFVPPPNLRKDAQKAAMPYDVWWVMLGDPRVRNVERLAEVFGGESPALLDLLPIGGFWPREDQIQKAIAFFRYIPKDKVRMLCEKARRPKPIATQKIRSDPSPWKKRTEDRR